MFRTGALCVVIFASAVLQGCGLGKTYREINPEGADLEVNKYNGYYTLKQVAPGTAKLVMRSEGIGVSVQFSTSTSLQACEGFSKPITVADAGHGVLLPSIAKMVRRGRKGFAELQLTPQQVLQVRAYSAWSSSSNAGPNMPTTVRTGECGPLTTRFTPQADHAYVARLLYPDPEHCNLIIEDATNPDAPISINADQSLDLEMGKIQQCSKPDSASSWNGQSDQ